MKLLNFNKVLCLSPHPDDVEYSMLGTILKHQDTHFTLCQIAQGGDCDETTGEHRLEEVRNVWAKSGCKNIDIIFSGHKYLKELSEEQWIHNIEQLLDNSYDAIFLPNNTDSHFEHRFISGFGRALVRNKNISLIHYYTPSTQDEWCPNMYIDISSEYAKKTEALKEFVSQQHRYYFRSDVLKAFHSDFQCAKKGVHIIEKYEIAGLII